MKLKIKAFRYIIIGLGLLFSQLSYSDTTVINNNNAAQDSQSSCNNDPPPTDPRVPPPGSYQVNTGNGSSQQLYTTGETKPYMVDNGCNSNNNVAPIQPYVTGPIRPRRH